MPTLTVSSPAADRSLVSLEAVKAELNITDTASDALLTQWIADDSDTVLGSCGWAPDQAGRRCAITETVTVSYRASEVPCSHNAEPLILPWRLPWAISAVTVDGEALTVADDVEALPMAGLLYRLNSRGERCRWSRGRIVITGSTGWDLADVPAALRGAVIELARIRWHAKDRDPSLRSWQYADGTSESYHDRIAAPSGAMPSHILEQISPFRNAVIA